MRLPTQRADLIGLLTGRSAEQPSDVAYVFADGEGGERPVTYRELDTAARVVAVRLLAADVRPGDRALLLYPPGAEYVTAFFGCLYAGVTAVPVYPPANRLGLERVLALSADSGAVVAMTDAASLAAVRARFDGPDGPGVESVRWLLATEDTDVAEAGEWTAGSPDPAAIAFLQYTSGSTARPKGVLVSHGNLLENSAVIAGVLSPDQDTRSVSWLPPYHDMGLIGGILQPLYSGFPGMLLSPLAFLHRPVRWLRAMSDFGATASAAPDFAYAECVRRVSDEEAEGLDLSRWRHALVGAEPVRSQTLRAFAERFGPAGFRAEAFLPCYGLAEATLFVTGVSKPALPTELTVDRGELSAGTAVEAGSGVTLVGCGPVQGAALVIADPVTFRECQDGSVGEIWVSGPSVTAGYWQAPEETARAFGARLADDDQDRTWLRTGDLGFQRAGELFVTGRLKELIVVRGANHYPADIELTAARAGAVLAAGRGAAFAVEDAETERVVLVHEVARGFASADLAETVRAVREAVTGEHGLDLHDIALVRPGSVPRTSSGKVRRSACRDAYLDGTLPVLVTMTVPDTGQPENLAGKAHDAVAELVAEALQLAPSALEPDRPLVGQGLDSLRAMRLRAALQTELGVEVALDWLLSGGTAAEIAKTTREGTRADGIPRLDDATTAPASFGQERLWLLDQVGASSAYHIAGRVDWSGEPGHQALLDGIRLLIDRHALLRTGFRLDADGQVGQHVVADAAARFDLPVSQVADDAALDEACARLAAEPFDLGSPPLLRAALMRVSATDRWVLALCVHHIVADDTSLGILTSELSTVYEALAGGAVPVLPEVPTRYRDFAAWQRETDSREGFGEADAYWRERLAGAVPLELPADGPSEATRSFEGATLAAEVPPDLLSKVRELAAAHELTPFMVLAAAWSVALSRWSGQVDVVLGTATAGRSRPELSEVVGFFANTLPLRVNLGDDPSFGELLGRVREACLGAYAHQELPFERIVRAAGQDQAGAHGLSIVRNLLVLRDRLPVLGSVQVEQIPTATAKFDVSLEFSPAETGGLTGFLEYAKDVLTETAAAGLVSAFAEVLRAGVADAGLPVWRLPIMPRSGEAGVLQIGYGGEPSTGHPTTVEWFEAVADQAGPEKALIMDGGEALSVPEVEERANRLAWWLRGQGVERGSRIGICLERSTDMVVALWGIWKAGGVYVPLDPANPAGRLARMVAEADLVKVLTTQSLHERLPASVDRVRLDDGDLKREIAAQPAGRPAVVLGPEDPAYVLFTSGSTGAPKGVVNTHGGLTNRLRTFEERLDLTAHDVALIKTPIGFDVSMPELVWPLLTGARMVLAEPGGHRDPVYLHGVLERHGVTICHFVPLMLRAFLECGVEGRYPALRVVMASGEELPAVLASDFLRAFPGVRLVNTYGPAETAVDITLHEVAEPLGARVSLGGPTPGVTLYVLDRRLSPVPVGVVGELFIGGCQLASGYAGQPRLTAAKFVPSPFGDGERLYATGDQVRWIDDGTLEFWGRLDFQIKIRSQRVELGEIEAALREIEGVVDAVVVAPEDPRGGRFLAAYLVSDTATPPESDRLLAVLRERLPSHMVPAVFTWLPSIPVSANGKVDRPSLPAVTLTRDSEIPHVAPRDELETRLAEIWTEVLGVPGIGVHDSFFDLGGHSLLATKVLSRIRAILRVELQLADLLTAHLTVELLAEQVRSRRLQQASPSDLREVLAMVAELSESETAARLAVNPETL
ncbi:non-ribosomal peptide synthetase [Amycolatopsis alba]|uniref:Non-ribosomal peptide synthetase n=1 Tax=Amycolatopsis alba DSM 44262 TaxID=1125972 RepID=A0A229RF21_AMYAL|nr:non-ribosomal peptide synthetase [Amycolatopsis alba]OXM45014.1 non-ribosomal peptide synthetase [Amycolatopsis alba DSM 44262]